jgi:hypothetical protein
MMEEQDWSIITRENIVDGMTGMRITDSPVGCKTRGWHFPISENPFYALVRLRHELGWNDNAERIFRVSCEKVIEPCFPFRLEIFVTVSYSIRERL